MSIRGYFQEIRQLLADSLFIASHSITEEERPPSAYPHHKHLTSSIVASNPPGDYTPIK